MNILKWKKQLFLIALISIFLYFEIPEKVVTENYSKKLVKQENHFPNEGKIKNKRAVKYLISAFRPTANELQILHERNRELTELVIDVIGIKIDRKFFSVESPEQLPRQITVPLPGGKSIHFNQEHIDFRGKNDFVWLGRHADKPHEKMSLSFYGDAVVGEINANNNIYKIGYLSSGKEAITHIDHTKYPKNVDEEAMDMLEINHIGFSSNNYIEKITSLNRKKLSISSVPKVIIDILFGYTPAVADSLGSDYHAISTIKHALTIANQVYKNSQTGVQWKSMGIIRLEGAADESNKVVLRRMLRDIDFWENRNTMDPYQLLLDKRHLYKADIVSVFTSVHDNTCGLAYVYGRRYYPSATGIYSAHYKNFSFNTVRAGCLAIDLSHELGHNLGLLHNRKLELPTDYNHLHLPYSYGYRSENRDNPFRTIMSFVCLTPNLNCSQSRLFSSPHLTYNGSPTGIDGIYDSVRSIRETAHVIRDLYSSLNIPEIVEQPRGGAIPIDGTTLTLSVVSRSPTSTMTYQWYRDGVSLEGRTGRVLSLTNAFQGSALSTYHVVVRNEYGVNESSKAVVTFTDSFIIAREPQSGTVYKSFPYNLSIIVDTPQGVNVSYKWYKDDRTLAGESSTALNIVHPGIVIAPSAQYRVEVSAVIEGSTIVRRSKNVRVFFSNKPSPFGAACVTSSSP